MEKQLNTVNAVWGGILLSILGNIDWQDIKHTVILATVGTVVSYCISSLLKLLTKKLK